MTITNIYFNGRVFHKSDYRGYVIIDVLQGTYGPIPGSKTYSYPRARG